MLTATQAREFKTETLWSVTDNEHNEEIGGYNTREEAEAEVTVELQYVKRSKLILDAEDEIVDAVATYFRINQYRTFCNGCSLGAEHRTLDQAAAWHREHAVEVYEYKDKEGVEVSQ